MGARIERQQYLSLHPFFIAVGRLYYRLTGWKLVGEMPDVPKSVIVVAPHTSNWDFMVFMMGSFVLGIRGQWLGKHTLFIGPLGWLFRKFGGIPLDRSSKHDLVSQAVTALKESPQMNLVLSPEGTRKKSDHWKSGFYYFALGAQVPILLAYADYRTKTAGIGATIWPTGDVEADLANIRAFYQGITPRHPGQESDIRFRNATER